MFHLLLIYLVFVSSSPHFFFSLPFLCTLLGVCHNNCNIHLCVGASVKSRECVCLQQDSFYYMCVLVVDTPYHVDVFSFEYRASPPQPLLTHRPLFHAGEGRANVVHKSFMLDTKTCRSIYVVVDLGAYHQAR